MRSVTLAATEPTMSQEKQEADYTAEVDSLLPQLEKLSKVCMDIADL